MITIVAIDDDNEYLLSLETMLDQFFADRNMEYEALFYTNSKRLFIDMEIQGLKPDMVFMDIELNGENGIVVTDKINLMAPFARIFFMTNHMHYATDVYTVKHSYFVIKEELEQRLEDIMKIYFSGTVDQEPLIASANQHTYLINKQDIIYIERGRRSCVIHTVKENIKVSNYFEDLILQLPSPYFLRCHNSFVVNLSYV